MIINAYQESSDGIGGVSVVSGGHIFARKDREICRPEGRADYLLFYVAKGSEHFFLDREIIAEEGSFVIYRPHEKQIHIQKEGRVSEFFFVHFNAEEGFDLFGLESSRVYKTVPSAQVKALFAEILDELQAKRHAYEKICVSKLFIILATLRRQTLSATDESSVRAPGRVAFVIEKINRDYSAGTSLEEYARICNMSKYYFIKAFKRITGIPPIEYRNRIRLEHARELLERSDFSVAEIGRMLGYSSGVYFSEAFKKELGVSPAAYRASALREKKVYK